ncbi:MAG: hypothetical protein SFZ02_03715 [bacterium]|nr:hypothetical protein [bacterium]
MKTRLIDMPVFRPPPIVLRPPYDSLRDVMKWGYALANHFI